MFDNKRLCVSYINDAPPKPRTHMFFKLALFYAAIALLYFAVQYLRSRRAARWAYTPPTTVNIAFVVRVFMQNGRWGLVLQRFTHYYRLPMLLSVDERVYLGRAPCLVTEYTDDTGRRTRVVVFTAQDELAFPRMMPRAGVELVDAERVIDMVKNMRGEMSLTTHGILTQVQASVLAITGKADFGWFAGL